MLTSLMAQRAGRQPAEVDFSRVRPHSTGAFVLPQADMPIRHSLPRQCFLVVFVSLGKSPTAALVCHQPRRFPFVNRPGPFPGCPACNPASGTPLYFFKLTCALAQRPACSLFIPALLP